MQKCQCNNTFNASFTLWRQCNQMLNGSLTHSLSVLKFINECVIDAPASMS